MLFAERRYAGAYYLCGYAVECALKACIAGQTKRGEFPDPRKARDGFTHDLVRLVKVAELDVFLEAEERADALFRQHWSVVKDWSEESRYQQRSAAEARDLLAAVTDSRHGVLQWVRRHW